MFLFEWATSRMSAANTLEAVLGIAAIVAFLVVSYLTLFFTKIHIKIPKQKKEEK